MTTLKEKHTKTIKEMKILLKAIQESTQDSLGDKSREKFLYNVFAAKWRKSGRSKELKALMRSLGIRASVGTALFRDPKKLYLELNEKKDQLEEAMGSQKASDLVRLKKKYGTGLGDRGIFTGIKIPSNLSLLVNDVNPEYNRDYDKQVIRLNKQIAERTKADYLRSTDKNAPGYDPEAWRLELPEGHPERSITVRDQVYNIKGTQLAGTPGVDGGPPKHRAGTIYEQAFADTAKTEAERTKLNQLLIDNKGEESERNNNNRRSGRRINQYDIDIEQPDGSYKRASSIQRNLLKAGFQPEELTQLMINDKDWQRNRGR